jgi:tRNA (cytidine/uridine-2'-O-)-methyltransferase
VFVKLYPSWGAYQAETLGARRFLFSAYAAISLWEARFQPGDHLVFGAETTGLPREVLEGGDGTPTLIPMLDDRRGLNLSTSAGIATYEALRQLQL